MQQSTVTEMQVLYTVLYTLLCDEQVMVVIVRFIITIEQSRHYSPGSPIYCFATVDKPRASKKPNARTPRY